MSLLPPWGTCQENLDPAQRGHEEAGGGEMATWPKPQLGHLLLGLDQGAFHILGPLV